MERDRTTIIKSNTDIHKQISEAFSQIELFFRGAEYRYSKADLPITIGRDAENCQLVTHNSTASRKHCTLEVRDNQIGLCDSSTNGTYIKIGRSDTILIKNSFYPLLSQGNFSLGEPINLESPDIVYFRVNSKPKTA